MSLELPPDPQLIQTYPNILACRLIAGLLSWAGASSFAELGSALPMNGGAQVVGPFSFLLSSRLRPRLNLPPTPVPPSSLWSHRRLLLLILQCYRPQAWLASYHCSCRRRVCFSTRLSNRVQFRSAPRHSRSSPNSHQRVRDLDPRDCQFDPSCLLESWYSSSKRFNHIQGEPPSPSPFCSWNCDLLRSIQAFCVLLVFVGGCVYLGAGRGTASPFTFVGSTQEPAGVALALFSALWSYDGWDQANYVSRDCAPGSLPTVIHSSMGIVVGLFLAANISYFIVLPFAAVSFFPLAPRGVLLMQVWHRQRRAQRLDWTLAGHWRVLGEGFCLRVWSLFPVLVP